jgi:hypothetical protein
MKVLLVLILFCTSVIAGEVGLVWEAPVPTTESPAIPVGYRIHYGTASHAYTKVDAVPLQTEWIVSGLTKGTWYFAATAIDADGNESDYSNEVSQVIAGNLLSVTLSLGIVTTPGPAITFVMVAATGKTDATIVWKTSVDCSGTVYYGTYTGRLSSSVVANNLGTTDHSAMLSSLVARTHYFYQVKSVCSGTTISSTVGSFNTK